MGLDCSHDAFHGAYSAFNSFRQVICKAFGGSFPPHNFKGFKNGVITRDMLLGKEQPLDNNMIYFNDPTDENTVEVPDGLYLFLTHSDCDGDISPELCIKVADDLEQLLPKIKAMTGTPWSGSIEHAGGYEEATKKFIDGCRLAARKNEPLLFR